MNVILIGTNGAGKTTVANYLHKKGYHTFKEAPTGNNHLGAAMLCLQDLNIVFDRWNVLDRNIYEGEDQYLKAIKLVPDIINQNNVIIFMSNYHNNYDPSHSEERVVQRPDQERREALEKEYKKYYDELNRAKIIVYRLIVHEEPRHTFNEVDKIIKFHKSKAAIQFRQDILMGNL